MKSAHYYDAGTSAGRACSGNTKSSLSDHAIPPFSRGVTLEITRDYCPYRREYGLRITASRTIEGQTCQATLQSDPRMSTPIGVSVKHVLENLSREVGKHLVFM